MADTIQTHYATEFSTNWIHRVQQTKSKLEPYVASESFMGERKRYDRLYKQASRERTTRKAPTPITDVTSDFRWVHRKTYDLANLLAEEDAKNLAPLMLPDSEYVKQHAMEHNRNTDSVIISAATGSVFTGESGTTSTAFDSAYAIAAGGTGLTLAKLLSTREILELADLEDGAQRVIVCSPKQITDLLNTTEVKNADYNTVRALAAGQIDTFMGFKFVYSNLLSKASTTRTCFAMVTGAVKLVKGAMKTTITIREDMSRATQIFSSWDLSAVRIYDEGVVKIDCTES